MILSIKTEAEPVVLQYINETLERIKNKDDVKKNPFSGTGRFCMRKEGDTNKLYTVIKLDSFYFQVAFNLMVFFIGAILLMSLITGAFYFPTYAVFIACFVVLFSLMTTNVFYYAIVKTALRKKGYKGPIKQISLSEFLEVAYFDTIK